MHSFVINTYIQQISIKWNVITFLQLREERQLLLWWSHVSSIPWSQSISCNSFHKRPQWDHSKPRKWATDPSYGPASREPKIKMGKIEPRTRQQASRFMSTKAKFIGQDVKVTYSDPRDSHYTKWKHLGNLRNKKNKNKKIKKKNHE